jgi:hypothetical protein
MPADSASEDSVCVEVHPDAIAPNATTPRKGDKPPQKIGGVDKRESDHDTEGKTIQRETSQQQPVVWPSDRKAQQGKLLGDALPLEMSQISQIGVIFVNTLAMLGYYIVLSAYRLLYIFDLSRDEPPKIVRSRSCVETCTFRTSLIRFLLL